MGSKYLDILLLLIGLLAVGYSQQYEVEPNRAWQPSRTQRTQNPSLFGNAQSSPKRVPAARNPLPEVQFEQPRLRQQVTRSRTTRPPSPSPQIFTTAQYRSREEIEPQRTSSEEPPADINTFRNNQPIEINRRGGRQQSRPGFRTTTTAEPQRTTESLRTTARRGNYESRTKQETGTPAIPKPRFPTASEELLNIQSVPTIAPYRSSEQVSSERVSAERHGYRKPQRTGSSESSERLRFSPRAGPTAPAAEPSRQSFRPDPTKISSREQLRSAPARPSSREQFRPFSSEKFSRPSSREETSPPASTESYTEPITTNKQSRGRARASTPKPTSIRQRPTSRGEKKSDVAIALKHDDDNISDEDNYPKEFLEKIKNSAERPKPSFSPKPTSSGGSRFGRARTHQVKPQLRPSGSDSDVSESIHEDIIDQGLSLATKPREIPSPNKNRYFARPKFTTTSSTTTTTTPATRPTASNVDTLRQRYLDKLKQSQEERQQKLSGLRPKLQTGVRPESEKTVERKSTTVRSFTKEPFKTTSRYSRTQKNRYEPKIHPPSAPAEPQSVRFRPRFSLTSREPDSSIEPATPTVAEHARTRNRYARLRKEELSVETPEVKTSWTSGEEKPKSNDAAYNFIRLRTKDLTPLASEDVMESIIDNDVLAAPTTTSSTEPPVTTTRSEETTQPPLTTAPITTIVTSSETIDSSVNEVTTVPTKETTTLRDPVTVAPVQVVTELSEEKTETIMMNLASASTRFRFSSKYSTETTTDNSATELTTMNDAPASTISFSTISPDTSTSSSTTITTTLSTTKEPATTTKKTKPKTSTTPVPSFLQNRPILRNLVALFAPSSTTTTKPITTRKPKKATKPKPKTTKKPSTVSTTVKPSSTTTTAKPVADNTISPLPLAANAEEIINSTQAVINNHTSPGNTFGKVPRDELDALTPLSFINTTESSTTVSGSLADRASIPETTEEMKNVTSQSVFFDYSSTTEKPMTVATTTASTTTTADYFVYGIYPNNTVVRKRAWKTFDYEKYMTPYVIFGIYPNNTIVRKFPNGTIINDEFMTSDNEIGGPSSSSTSTSTSTTTTTTTTELPVPEESTTVEPTTAEPDGESEPVIPNEIDEIVEGGDEDTTEVGSDEITTASPQEETTEVSQTETTENPQEGMTEEVQNETTERPAEETSEATQTEAAGDPLEETVEASPEETVDSPEGDVINEPTDEMIPTDKSKNMKERTNLITDEPAESDVTPETTTLRTTTEEPTTDEGVFTVPPSFWRSGIFGLDETTSTMRSETPSTMKNTEETTLDPSINQVLPLSLEEIQSLWSGNFSDSADNETDAVVSSSINLEKSANLLAGLPDKEPVSLTSIAFRALSTSGSTGSTTTVMTTMGMTESTTEAMTSTPEPTTRKPRVKFVTLTPSVMMTSDPQADDAITQSSEHVQRVTKASTQIPNDVLTSVFGQLEEKASSPIPDILKDVGSEVEGDGLTAALARRIIALAMERAKSTTTDTPPTTTTEMSTTMNPTTFATKTTKKAKSTRTTSKAQSSPLNSLSSVPGGKELDNVLKQLIQAQNLEQSLIELTGSTTVKAPEDLEKTVENQIRLAEEVRKASRTMKKKKKNRTTTTPPPPPFLGFLFNFFNRPLANPAPLPNSGRSAKKVQPPSPSPIPDGQVFVLTSLPTDVDATSSTDTEVQGERQTRGQLLTAAIDVTRAVSKFMGTVISNAAQSFQSFMRNNNWGR